MVGRSTRRTDVRTADGRAVRQTAGQWHGQMEERTVSRSVRQMAGQSEGRQTGGRVAGGPAEQVGILVPLRDAFFLRITTEKSVRVRGNYSA